MLGITANGNNSLDVNPCTSMQTHTQQNQRNKTSAPTDIMHREKNFSLNLEKALENKILATKRDIQFEYHCTGGGIVESMDTITFELVKNAIPHYYNIISIDKRRAEVTNDIDKNELNLSKVFKLHEN